MFLPTTAKELRARGWDWVDVIIFTADAYIDHPSFGTAVVSRLLESAGYRVAVVPQPSWRDDLRDFKKLGAPRLFFGVNAGAMDSMVNHYTANLRLRSDDAYTPGGEAGMRPDRAVEVYTKILKELYPHTPVVIGGVEASLRRLTHYDYWSNSLHPSILSSSGADLLLYGMCEGVILPVAKALSNGFNAKLLRKLSGVAFLAEKGYAERLPREKVVELSSYEECLESKQKFSDNFILSERVSSQLHPDKVIVEPMGDKVVVVTPPPVVTSEELDRSFDLPYMRAPHPKYKNRGEIPAWEMIRNSINIHHGCFGGCSFCAIAAHQGKHIISRSERSILSEVEALSRSEGFKGVISDIGAPSANMYRMGGVNKELCKSCTRPSCLHPTMCKNLDNNHRPILALYKKILSAKGIKRAYVGSGIRYDLFDDSPYLESVICHHTSGRLKVAPEHTEDGVLKLMRKPPFRLFEKLNNDFKSICAKHGLKYQLIPYFISSHPGCTREDMQRLSAKVLGGLNFNLEQVQDLTPTPMTLSSVMFYTGENPYTHRRLYVARSQDDKREQKSFFFKQRSNNSPKKISPSRRKNRIK